MLNKVAISNVIGREIIDSRGNPTVEVDVILENNVEHKAPDGEVAFFLFVDPTSHFAEVLRENFFKGEQTSALNLPCSC